MTSLTSCRRCLQFVSCVGAGTHFAAPRARAFHGGNRCRSRCNRCTDNQKQSEAIRMRQLPECVSCCKLWQSKSAGQTSELLLNALPNLTLLGVDPYPGRYNGQVSADRFDQMGAVENMRSLTAELPCFLGPRSSYLFMAQISLHSLWSRSEKVLPGGERHCHFSQNISREFGDIWYTHDIPPKTAPNQGNTAMWKHANMILAPLADSSFPHPKHSHNRSDSDIVTCERMVDDIRWCTNAPTMYSPCIHHVFSDPRHGRGSLRPVQWSRTAVAAAQWCGGPRMGRPSLVTQPKPQRISERIKCRF